MKTNKFQTSVNRHQNVRYEVISPKRTSLTKPNDALTIKEILQRHVQGIPYSVNMVDPVFSEVFIPQVKRMDFTEIEELKKVNRARAEHLQNEIDKAVEQKAKAELALKDKEELTNFLSEIQKGLKTNSSKDVASK